MNIFFLNKNEILLENEFFFIYFMFFGKLLKEKYLIFRNTIKENECLNNIPYYFLYYKTLYKYKFRNFFIHAKKQVFFS